VPKDVDFLKIDVDSYDCEFLSEILKAGFRPKAIAIELAPAMPPPLKYMLHYSPGEGPLDSGDVGGCSLQMAVDLLKPYGYTLLQYVMEDGWFVRDEYVHLFGPIENDIVKVYDFGNPNLYCPNMWLSKEGDNMCKEMLMEFKSLRQEPAKMLQRAKEQFEYMFTFKPHLKSIKYTLTI